MLRNSISLLGLLFALVHAAVGQELTPRAYWPAPEGTRMVTIGYSHVSGDTIPDPSLPISGIESSIGTASVGYRQTLDLWGRTSNLIVQLPYSNGVTEGDGNFGQTLRRNYEGFGDVSATLSVNFLGAPSMDRGQFAQMRQNPNLIVGGSLKLVAPTGKYDSNRIINVGANRWAMKAELGLIAPLHRKWLLELGVGGWFFADNDDFLGFNRSQKPIAAVQAHLIHRFRPGFWASLDANFYRGGRSKVEDIRLDDLQRDAKVGLTLVFPFAPGHAFKLGYSLGSLNDSDEDFDVFQVAYSRLF
jgi:Putative MetA-pathway of phenol degradation